MQGGTLALGARAAISELDFRLQEALYWDYFFRTYGWTKETAETQNPSWLLDALAMIGEIRAEIESESRES